MRYAIILGLFSLSFNPQNEPNATVKQYRGIDVYHYSIPTRSYTVVKSGHFMNMGNGCDVEAGVQRAIDKKAQGVIITPEKNQWEAIVYN
jgi:hypothetical protein